MPPIGITVPPIGKIQMNLRGYARIAWIAAVPL